MARTWTLRLAWCMLAPCALMLAGCPLLEGLFEGPEAAFEATPVAGEAPLTVLFVDASIAGSANITRWQWDFGDGATSDTRNPTHIYQTPGVYNVSLTVTTDAGADTELKRDYIRVIELPVADFEAAPQAGSAPLTVAFTDASAPGSAPIDRWRWNFGDRSPTSSARNPSHTYAAPGLYTVTLTVTTADGQDTISKPEFVNVAGRPTADFSTDFTPGVAPLAVQFTDESEVGTAAITSWTWDFGDGAMSMDQNPLHTYTEPGVYTVSLAIETAAGNDRIERPDLIVVDEGPVAEFSGNPVMGSAPLTVAFTDASTAGSREITRRLWNFGDGGLLSTLRNPTRTYTEPGKYTVSLRVTTDAGANTAEKPDYITVTPGVAFSANQRAGRGALTVQFVDESATGALAVTARAWDFGDGGTSTEANPEHTYAEPGVYDVSLEITTDLGPSQATRPAFITVAPDTAFSAEPASGPPPLEVTFADETAAGALEVTAWAWDFGDGATSDEQSPVHTYETPGRYTVSLATETELGSDTERRAGLIAVNPVVDFTASAQTGQGTLTANFTDATNAGNLNILGWFWDFGDGTTSTAQNPSHTFGAIGSYDVALTVTTALGDHTETREAFIQVGPIVDFKADAVRGEGTLNVTFSDQTQAGSLEIEAWAWDFGDGMVSNEQNPAHEYMPGLYSVGLTVTTSQGDTTTVKEDLILVAPRVTLDFVQQSGPAPFEASLLDITMPGNFEVQGWLWNLGDGNTSEERNPVHVYEEPGTYTVTLTIITNGGEFSRTEPNFITALRGPTAAFTHQVARGGNPADPVTVTFTNMSLPGDSPILNQTWEFGESAIADDELAMEENPVVVYPGTAFDTIPQNVSLTVRTFIAADTLLRENLFGAPAAKSTLAPDLLDAADLTQITADVSGDVWVAGNIEADKEMRAILARLNPNADQRWGVEFNLEGTLEIAGLHAPGDGTVLAAGTWMLDGAAAIYLAHFDAFGEAIWETVYTGAERYRATGLTMLADGTVVVAGYTPADDNGVAPLFLLTCNANGSGMARQATELTAATDRTPIVAADANKLYVAYATPDGTVLARHEIGSAGVASTLGRVPGTPQNVGWNSATATALAATKLDTAIRIYAVTGGGIPTELLALPQNTPVALISDGPDAGIAWLHRDETTGHWTQQRQAISGG
ncbi:MAG: PKD domain-containing protein [Candidatus Hydrogenedentes bacterium]|nr:PKD domain-containing protein [Candidatus Hydrogenedentota bacterium]